MFFINFYVIYLTGFSTRPVCLAGGYTVSAVSRFEPHSYCHASRIMHVVGGGWLWVVVVGGAFVVVGGGGGGELETYPLECVPYMCPGRSCINVATFGRVGKCPLPYYRMQS